MKANKKSFDRSTVAEETGGGERISVTNFFEPKICIFGRYLMSLKVQFLGSDFIAIIVFGICLFIYHL